MTTVYDEHLKKAVELNYSIEKYEHLEKVMAIAKKAKLSLSSPLQIKDRIEFAISLASATALYDTYKTKGNDARIVYLNHEGQLVYHYADSRVEITDKRT